MQRVAQRLIEPVPAKRAAKHRRRRRLRAVPIERHHLTEQRSAS